MSEQGVTLLLPVECGKKCVFGTRRVEYLGHVIEQGHFHIQEDRVQALEDLPIPTTVHRLRCALGAFACIQRWVPMMADDASLFTIPFRKMED